MKRLYIILACLQLCFVTVNAENIIKNIDEKIKLGSFLILESELSEGKYIKANPSDPSFTAYDGKLLPKKLKITNRMYTLRTEFYVDENLKNGELSIYIGPSEYPYRIYINGILLNIQGRYKDGIYNSTAIYSVNQYLSGSILKYGNEKNEIAVELFPRYEVAPAMDIVLSSYYGNSVYAFWHNIFNIHLVQASVILAILISFYFVFLLFSRNKKEMKYLYFSLIGISFFFGYLNITFINESFNEPIFLKLARTGQSFSSVFFALFVIEFTGVLNKKWLKTLLVIIGTLTSAVYFFQGSKEQVQDAFNLLNKLTIAPILLLIIAVAVYALIKRPNIYNFLLIVGIAAVVFTSIRDIVMLGNNIVPYCWLVPYGFLFLILEIFFMLALEQSMIYTESIDRAIALNERNISVTSMIEKVGVVSGNLVRSSGNLETNISSMSGIFKEFEKTNRNITDRIISEFKNIEDLINKISVRIDSSGDRIPRAIMSQTAVVEETSATLANMNMNIESIMDYAIKTNEMSKTLSDLASQSSEIVTRSRNSINNIAGHSEFINNVLLIIEDITEKTNLLSINAAIESARTGDAGKGFAVVAHEIRELAKKSKDSLTSSFAKIKEMYDLIKNSSSLSDEVSNALFKIIEKSRSSFEMIEIITNLFKEQKDESNAILDGTKSLLNDTLTIKNMSEEETRENHEIKLILSQFKDSFQTVADLLKSQSENERNIHISIENINTVLSDNLKNIDMLNDTMNLTRKK
jgi:methyl-accepting chemotaxis protein